MMRKPSFFRIVFVLVAVLGLLLQSCGGGGGGGGIIPGGGPGNGITATDKIFYWYYPSVYGSAYDLYMLYGDGSGKRQISFTSNGQYKEFYGVTSDGFVIYLYQTDPLNIGCADLYSVPLNNPSQAATKLLASAPAATPFPLALTSDGRVIYKDTTGLYKVNPATGASTLIDAAAVSGLTYAEVWNNTVAYAVATTGAMYRVDASTSDAPVIIDTGSPWDLTIKRGYLFYDKTNMGAGQDLYVINLNVFPSPAPVRLTSGANNEYFVDLSSSADDRVVFSSYPGDGTMDLYSVPLAGGAPTALMATVSEDDNYMGMTSDNRVIVETGLMGDWYNTVTSIKADGTQMKTIGSGSTGATRGGHVEAVIPGGWVLYWRGGDITGVTSVSASNENARSLLTDWFTGQNAENGITSNERVVLQDFHSVTGGIKCQLYGVKPDGSGTDWLNTGNTKDSMDVVAKVVP